MEGKTCDKCGKVFLNPSGFKSHINRKTPCNIRLECNICNKIFKLKSSYDKHKTLCKNNTDILNESLSVYTNVILGTINNDLDDENIDLIADKMLKLSLVYILFRKKRKCPTPNTIVKLKIK